MSASPIALIRATNRFIPQIQALHVAGLQETHSFSLDPSLDADLDDIEASYARGLFLVAVHSDAPGRIVGMGALRGVGVEYEIKRMRVDAGHRRMGIGRAILNRLLAEARERCAKTITLDTAIAQFAAQRLYEGAGFVHSRDLVVGDVPSKLYRLEFPS